MNSCASRKFSPWTANRSRLWLCFVAAIVWVSIVASAPAQTSAPNSEPQFLSDQPELILASTQSWGELGWNVAAHAGDKPGEPLRIGERSFAKGLGHHANGAITVLLDGAFSDFDAEVGLQPCAAIGSVIFRVMVDGEPRFESRVLRSGDAPVAVHVAVAGAMELRLEAADADDGISCDMANWANARLTSASSAARVRLAEHSVDMARFARVATWDPNRIKGARASRIQEFRADDLFTERELKPDRNGNYTVPTWTNGVGCIGLQWLNRRTLRELALEFADGARVPSPDSVHLEGWFGESAWQGNWKPLTNECRLEERRLIFKLAPKAGAVQTQKIRWILPAVSQPQSVRLSAFTRSVWAATNLFVQIENPKAGARGEVTVWNGELVAKPETRNPKSEISWKLSQPLRLSVRYSRPSLFKSDPTVLQFRLPTGNVGIAVEDVLANDCVYLPDHGLFVVREPLPVMLADYKRRIAGRRTILEEVRALPDQTLAQAMAKTHHTAQSEGPVMLSLNCDNAKFVVERDGRVRFQTAIVTDTVWLKNAGELRPEFGQSPAELVTRQLDGGWLPSPVLTFRNAGVTYTERSFVAPCDDAGANPARLNRRSVCVTEFTLTNAQAVATPTRLVLNFLVNSREKTLASVAKCPQGWLVTGETGPLALVMSAADGGLTAATEGGTILFTGSLPPQGTARCVVFLRARDEDLLSLPPVANLRAAFESHWNAALAPAMQIETPDPLLNNVVRSSQVRCLIAARNEADGARVAAWIAAMHYGPLESEAHSVIRGMDFMGHADFARRSLDFFVHRYNTNGFLTTGYTTFGTAWHLWTVGEHYQLHHDQAWLRGAAPELARVGEWIVRQTDKTTQPAAAGRPEFGLMPPGTIADWNAFAYHFANNAYYYAALRELGAMLSEIHDSRGAKFTALAGKLRENTLRAYRWTQARSPAVALRNGAWTPHYPSQVHSPGALADFFPGQDGGRSWCYDVEIGAHQLMPTGVLDANSREVERMLEHMEDVQFLADGWFDYPATTNHGDWFNLGGFSKVQPYYTRNCEVYALRDDVKPFVRSYFNTLAAMLNPEVLTLWEHFNHSGAWDKTHETGYFLHQTCTMLVQERDNELWLAPFVTSNWLHDGQRVSVKNAPTRFGAVGYEINSHVAQGFIEARIEPPARSAPKFIVLRLRHPDGKPIRTMTVNGKAHRQFDPRAETIRILPATTKPIIVRTSY